MFHHPCCKWIIGLLSTALLLSSCTASMPAALTPTSIATSTTQGAHATPPGATLTINGQTQQAGVGSYCWTTGVGNASTTTCAETAGVPTARHPLVIIDATSFIGRFNLDILTPPDSVILTVVPITSADELPSSDGGHRLWQTGNGWGAGLPLKTEIEYPFQEAEFVNGNGLYLAELNAQWDQWGNINYDFLIQIGAGSSGLSEQLPSPTGGPVPTPVSFTLQTISPWVRIGKGYASSLAISPGGQRLGIVTPVGVYLFDTDSQQEIWFRTFENAPTTLVFSPDSSRLAVGSRASILSILDVKTGKTVLQINGQEDIHAVWSPDGTRLLVSGGCREISIWDADNATLLHTLQSVQCNDVTPGIVDAVWSSDGKRIYSDNSAWDASTYQPLGNYKPDMPEFVLGYSMLPSPTENLLAVGNGESIAILDGETGQRKQTFTPEIHAALENIAWSPDGTELVAGNYYEQFIWNVDTGKPIAGPSGYRARAGLAWLPDDKTLVGLFSPDGRLNAVNVITGNILFSLDGFDTQSYPKWDGNELLSYDGVNLVRWDPDTGKIVSRTPASPPADWASKYGGEVALSPDGKRVAAGPAVMDAVTGQELVHIAAASDHGWDTVAWSPDGKLIVSGDSLGINPVVVWDAQTGKVLLTLGSKIGGTSPFLGGLAWSPDGTQIVGGGSLMNSTNDGMLIIWDTTTGNQLRLLTDGMTGQRITALAWSPGGRWLATGLYNGRILLWDMHQYQPVYVLVGHADQVFGLTWCADGSLLASSGIDGTLLIWKRP